MRGDGSFNAGNLPEALRLKLALLAVGPWGEAQHIRVWHAAPGWGRSPGEHESLFQVLRDRKPDWLAKWADTELEERTMSDWHFVRRLVRAGLCPRPQSDHYILKMLLGGPPPPMPSLTNFLWEDAALLDHEVWRIFELSPVRDTILWAADADDPEQPNSWAGALRNLSRAGKLDRQRLLLASLTALLRNTEARNTGWFARLHELLEPTDEERQALQTTYMQLLSHPVGGVVGLALNGLTRLRKVHKLDVPGFLGAVPAMFHLKAKTQPLQALRLVKTLIAEPTAPVPQAVESLLAALAHEAVEVQEAALELLHRLADRARGGRWLGPGEHASPISRRRCRNRRGNCCPRSILRRRRRPTRGLRRSRNCWRRPGSFLRPGASRPASTFWSRRWKATANCRPWRSIPWACRASIPSSG